MTFSGMLRCVLWKKFTGVSDMLIALMTEAANTFKTSVNIYQTTQRSIPDDSRLHIHRRENLKSDII
jgi:hypothetical protein